MITFDSNLEMRNPRKLSRIRLLMITSHLLLTIFVMHWLVTRYNQEKTSLKKELDRELLASENKMLDSLLLVKVVNPFLHSASTPKIKMFVMTDRGNSSIVRVQKKGLDSSEVKTIGSMNPNTDSINIRIDGNSKIYSNVNPDSVTIRSDFFIDSMKSKDFREKFLLQSIKVLTEKTSDTSRQKKSITLKFTTGIDSVFVKKDFEKNPLANNFKLVWSGNKKQNDNTGILIETKLLECSMTSEVLHYQFYLFKKISPQIIFGLILILLTGIAFTISFVSLRKQVELNKIRNDFVANISHELKTPVATVKVALEALQNFNVKNEPAQADEYIRIAQLEMNRLDMLIQNVLTSSVYDEVHDLMQPESLSLKEIVEEVMRSMQIRLKQVEADLSLDFGNLDIKVFGDRLHIQGLLINLVDNSLKYVEGKPKISIRIIEQADNIILTVTDNGIGIPEEYLSKVFDKFFRVPSENRHNVKGYGLGLSYAQMVMKKHKGKISVENQKGGGCTFFLSFPKRA